MYQATSRHEQILYALEIVSSLTDDELREYRENIKPAHQRLSRRSRSLDAMDFLDKALEEFPSVEAFLYDQGDLTPIILRADYGSGDTNPASAFITGSSCNDPQKWLLRALARRSIVRSIYEQQTNTMAFIRANRLPNTTTVANSIGDGTKPDQLEKSLGGSGIWLILMPVLSLFRHVPQPEITVISQLLLYDERFYSLRRAALTWSRCFDRCQALFDLQIRM
ncbi:hypothetical protein BDV27DRAFT_2875 [Aspergillus caelatus]|uniref:Uncharacterized protein n=1 Tax=Aspergillus caelatus TaxID=61420 RepID=A0A5N7A2W1_9EURO|nr:uncharacterized protein BDV27DRAFT_2875 [Aspergillus caelatus]KAE8363893.1 hypothetical protein BDV27DRAFT_2875 [Aspergillus caelatus]